MSELGTIVYLTITIAFILAGAYKNKTIGVLGGVLLTAFPFLFIDVLGFDMMVNAIIALAGIGIMGAMLQESGYF